MESEIWQNPVGLKIWMWCLLKASHEERVVLINRTKITLKPGQFIFGRISASEELGQSPSTVRNWITFLNKDSYLDIKPTNKYSIVTIKKWNQYQDEDINLDNRITTEKKQNNTNKNVKNDKNINNKEKIIKKKIENNYPEISDLKETDITEISTKYQTTTAFIRSKIEDMRLWAGQPRNASKIKGRNWRLTLMDWVKRDRLKIMQKQNERQTKFAIIPGAE